jgi:hypothetical protein
MCSRAGNWFPTPSTKKCFFASSIQPSSRSLHGTRQFSCMGHATPSGNFGLTMSRRLWTTSCVLPSSTSICVGPSWKPDALIIEEWSPKQSEFWRTMRTWPAGKILLKKIQIKWLVGRNRFYSQFIVFTKDSSSSTRAYHSTDSVLIYPTSCLPHIMSNWTHCFYCHLILCKYRDLVSLTDRHIPRLLLDSSCFNPCLYLRHIHRLLFLLDHSSPYTCVLVETIFSIVVHTFTLALLCYVIFTLLSIELILGEVLEMSKLQGKTKRNQKINISSSHRAWVNYIQFGNDDHLMQVLTGSVQRIKVPILPQTNKLYYCGELEGFVRGSDNVLIPGNYSIHDLTLA